MDTKRKQFTTDDDNKLISIIQQKGINDWKLIAELMGNKTVRQCRNRYNQLEDKIANKWTPEEDKIIISKFKEIGPKWVSISKLLHNRTPRSVKNRWLSLIKNYKKENIEDDCDLIFSNLFPIEETNEVDYDFDLFRS